MQTAKITSAPPAIYKVVIPRAVWRAPRLRAMIM
jgi:hypothetical protein